MACCGVSYVVTKGGGYIGEGNSNKGRNLKR